MEKSTEPYIVTYSGKKFTFLNPQVEQIDIKDIAFSLANQCRFNGHVPYFSVAEHSIAVAARVAPEFQLAALLHDAAEAYLGDVPTPIKQYIVGYEVLEAKVQQVIEASFSLSLSDEARKAIKEADRNALYTEATYLLEDSSWVPKVFKASEEFRPRMLPPPEAAQAFLYWYRELSGEQRTIAEQMGL